MEPFQDLCILKSEADELDPCLVDVLQNLTTLNGPLYTELTKEGFFSTYYLQITTDQNEKMTQKTYDVSFSVYYQGFYDSSVFNNMTDSVMNFLESGRMNGSGRFST